MLLLISVVLGAQASRLQQKGLRQPFSQWNQGKRKEQRQQLQLNELKTPAAGLALVVAEVQVPDVPATRMEIGLIMTLTRLGAAPQASIMQFVKIAPSLFAAVLGIVLSSFPVTRLAGFFVIFFAAQSFMNLYMKLVMSEFDLGEGLHGVPVPFLMVVIQQLVSFFIVAFGILVSQVTPWAVKPVFPKNFRQACHIFGLSFVFAANIGLNNFSVSLLDISLNQMIRSTTPVMLPLVYLMLQDKNNHTTSSDRFWLGLGAVGVLGSIVAKTHGFAMLHSSLLGITVCLISVLASCFELIMIKNLSQTMKMSPADTVMNMALPVAVILLIPAFCIELPNWKSHGLETNWVVFQVAHNMSQWVLPLILLSGVFAAFYNQLLYRLVQQFSPEHTAFASNSNKLATISLSLILGFEAFPGGYLNALLVVSVVVGCGSFAMFSVGRSKGK